MQRFALIAFLLLFGAGMASLGWFFGVRSDAISRDEAIGIAMTGEVIEVRHESVRKADEELSGLAKHLGISAAHLMPKAKQNQQAIMQSLQPQ